MKLDNLTASVGTIYHLAPLLSLTVTNMCEVSSYTNEELDLEEKSLMARTIHS